MTIPSTDPVAAAIAERNEAYIARLCLTEWTVAQEPSGAVRRLLKAVHAALRHHQPGPIAVLGHLCPVHEGHRHFSITSTEAAGIAACPDCSATALPTCAGCRVTWPCDEFQGISAALTGEEGK